MGNRCTHVGAWIVALVIILLCGSGLWPVVSAQSLEPLLPKSGYEGNYTPNQSWFNSESDQGVSELQTVIQGYFVIYEISQNSAPVGTTIQVSIQGDGFMEGVRVNLSRNGNPQIAGTQVVRSNQTDIGCQFSIPVGTSKGYWNVVAINPSGRTATYRNGFYIGEGMPEVVMIQPAIGIAGTSVPITFITGYRFKDGATVALMKTGYSSIYGTGVSVMTNTTITGTFIIPSDATSGSWDVVVTNPDGLSGRLAKGFTILTGAPVIRTVWPSAGSAGSIVPISVLGLRNFMAGSEVSLVRSGTQTIYAQSEKFYSGNLITCILPLSQGCSPGAYDLVVTNPDRQSGKLTNGFSVRGPTPIPESIEPSTGMIGSTVTVQYLEGSYFQTGAQVALKRSGSADIQATRVTVKSSGQVFCMLDIPQGTVCGEWDVAVTNPDGQVGTLTKGFMITPENPVIKSIRPTSGLVGANLVFRIDGDKFVSGARVNLTRTGYNDISAGIVNVYSSSLITGTFAIPTSSQTGRWDLKVINPDGKYAILKSGINLKG